MLNTTRCQNDPATWYQLWASHENVLYQYIAFRQGIMYSTCPKKHPSTNTFHKSLQVKNNNSVKHQWLLPSLPYSRVIKAAPKTAKTWMQSEAESKDKVWMTKLTHDLSPIVWSASFIDRPRPTNDKQMHKRLQLQEGVLRVPCS